MLPSDDGRFGKIVAGNFEYFFLIELEFCACIKNPVNYDYLCILAYFSEIWGNKLQIVKEKLIKVSMVSIIVMLCNYYDGNFVWRTTIQKWISVS